MSVSNLREYARRCATESEVREQARAFGLDNLQGHINLAKSMGLDWDTADMVAFQKEVTDAEGDLADLSEEELQQVAGGVCTTTAIVVGSVAAGAAAGAVAGGVVVGAAVGGFTAAAGGGW